MKVFSGVRTKAEFFLPLVIAAGFLYLLVAAKAAFFPFVLGIALAYVLNPFVAFFENRGFKRLHVVAALYLVVGLIAVYCIYSLVALITNEVTLLTDQWPVYMEKFRVLFVGLETKLLKKAPFLKDVYSSWGAIAAHKAAALAETVPMMLIKMIPGLTLLVLVPFISFFLLAGGQNMLHSFLDLLPSRFVEMALHVVCEADESLGNYMRGIFVEAAILFALAFVGLSYMGLEYAGGIALAMGIGSLIPYVGPIVGGILGGIAAFVQFSSLGAVVKVVMFFVSLRFVDDWFLQPIILERAVKVHPTIILFSLLAGAEMFGIWGIIFAMPVTCIIKVFLSIAVELHRTEFAWKPKPEPTRISIPYT